MTRFSSSSLLLGGLVALAVGVWLAFDSPEVAGETCRSAWASLTNGDGRGQACRDASRLQLWEAATVVAASVGLVVAGLVVRRRERAAG